MSIRDLRTRRAAIGQTTRLAVVAAVLACGQDPAPAATPPSVATPPSEAAPAKIPHRMPSPSDPSLAPRLRAQMRSQPQIQRFVTQWKLNPAGIWSNTFLGVPTIQNPLDVWVTHEIMYDVKPDFLIETGTLYGGSAALWATFLEQINPEARVITIDIQDRVTEARELPIWKRKVDFLVGSSSDPAIVADVAKRVSGRPVLVILDSDHSEEHVLRELEAYAPLVNVGSYLIVQDTGGYYQPPEQEYPGGGRAINRFLQANDAFEIDRDRERWVLTNNARGFVRRVR
jgi:cephalosporin hydroxylase